MTGCSSRCIEDRILPLHGAHVSQERVHFCWPLPHVIGSPDLGVLSASLTSDRPSGLPRVVGLSNPTSSSLNLTDLPCSHEILGCMPAVRTPEAPQGTCHCVPCDSALPPRATGSATSTTFDFGAIFPFTGVPAYSLPVYASQCPSPTTTQGLGTWLPARLCHGRHLRRLDLMRLQGATLIEPGVRISRTRLSDGFHVKACALPTRPHADRIRETARPASQIPHRWGNRR